MATNVGNLPWGSRSGHKPPDARSGRIGGREARQHRHTVLAVCDRHGVSSSGNALRTHRPPRQPPDDWRQAEPWAHAFPLPACEIPGPRLTDTASEVVRLLEGDDCVRVYARHRTRQAARLTTRRCDTIPVAGPHLDTATDLPVRPTAHGATPGSRPPPDRRRRRCWQNH
jgi:hypothetical protein